MFLFIFLFMSFNKISFDPVVKEESFNQIPSIFQITVVKYIAELG